MFTPLGSRFLRLWESWSLNEPGDIADPVRWELDGLPLSALAEDEIAPRLPAPIPFPDDEQAIAILAEISLLEDLEMLRAQQAKEQRLIK